MMTRTQAGLISEQVAKALWDAYKHSKLGYEFCPGSYTYFAFLNVARAYQLAADAARKHMRVDLPLDHNGELPPAPQGRPRGTDEGREKTTV
jgi:hypothetical protein